MKLAHYVINKLTPHGIPKIQFSPKFMLTQQTFDTCMFQFPLNIYSINGTISTWIFRGVRILLSKQCMFHGKQGQVFLYLFL